jgi:hypothetical protein
VSTKLPTYSDLQYSLRKGGEYKYVTNPIALKPFPVYSCAYDGVENAYPTSKISALQAVAKTRGEQCHPIRVHLNRYDWDLIHNHLVLCFEELSGNPSLQDAIYRLLVKIHQERNWLNIIFQYEQAQDNT